MGWLTLSPFLLPLPTTAGTVDASHAGNYETIPLGITHCSSGMVEFTQLHSKERIWFGSNGDNNQVESIESFLSGENWLPNRNRTFLSMIFLDLALTIKNHHQFSKSKISSILGEKFKTFDYQESRIYESSLFLNQQDGFQSLPLHRDAQEAPTFSISVADIMKDHSLDIFLGPNKFSDEFEITRHDNGHGIWMTGNGDGSFNQMRFVKTEFKITGQIRSSSINDFNQDGKPNLVVVEKMAKQAFAKAGRLYLINYPA